MYFRLVDISSAFNQTSNTSVLITYKHIFPNSDTDAICFQIRSNLTDK